MALYNDASNVTRTTYAEPFITEHKPGAISFISGIYRCTGCGDEIAHNKGNPLPPQNHHQHRTGLPVRWKLLVMAIQR